MIGQIDAGSLEIGVNLGQQMFLAVLYDVGRDELAGVGLGRLAGLAELFSGPQPQQARPPRLRLEAQLLVMRELAFETILALVECRHAASSIVNVTFGAGY